MQGLEDFLATLERDAAADWVRKPAPVERWEPQSCGDMDLVIQADGHWRHEGARMTRERLVRLFASVLRKDADGETYLVTPAEKIRIRVEDAAFLAVRADRQGDGEGQTIAFTTNMGDVVVAGPERPLRIAVAASGEPRPYVLVRGRLEARILRPAFYELVAWGVEGPDGRFGVWSGGAFFALD
jgi:hypothetical protein